MESDSFYPAGECFHRTWRKRMLLVATRVAECLPPSEGMIGNAQDKPLEFLEGALRRHGAFPVVKASYDITPLPGFDPISLILQRSVTMGALVRRWRGVVAHQTDAYFFRMNQLPSADLNLDEMTDIEKQSLYFNPLRFSLAQGSSTLAAVYTGVMLGVFRDLQLNSFVCYQLTSQNCSKKVVVDGQFVSHDVAEHAPWLVCWSGDINNQDSGAYLARRDAFPFASFIKGSPTPFIHKVAAVLADENSTGSLSHTAKALNVSERTFSRRMEMIGRPFKSFVRLSRFQRACLSFIEGESNVDDIAFHHKFSDRQHMSREFRHFGAISPACFRELLNTV